MYVPKNILKLDIFFWLKNAFHSILGKATFLSVYTSSSEKSQEWFVVEVFIVFFLFKTFSLFAFVCHPESIFW